MANHSQFSAIIVTWAGFMASTFESVMSCKFT